MYCAFRGLRGSFSSSALRSTLVFLHSMPWPGTFVCVLHGYACKPVAMLLVVIGLAPSYQPYVADSMRFHFAVTLCRRRGINTPRRWRRSSSPFLTSRPCLPSPLLGVFHSMPAGPIRVDWCRANHQNMLGSYLVGKYGRSLWWCAAASLMLIVAHVIFLGNANGVCASVNQTCGIRASQVTLVLGGGELDNRSRVDQLPMCWLLGLLPLLTMICVPFPSVVASEPYRHDGLARQRVRHGCQRHVAHGSVYPPVARPGHCVRHYDSHSERGCVPWCTFLWMSHVLQVLYVYHHCLAFFPTTNVYVWQAYVDSKRHARSKRTTYCVTGTSLAPQLIGFLQDMPGIKGTTLVYTVPIILFIICAAAALVLSLVLIVGM